MDYFVGFLIGYFLKSFIEYLRELSWKYFEIIEYDFDEDWD